MSAAAFWVIFLACRHLRSLLMAMIFTNRECLVKGNFYNLWMVIIMATYSNMVMAWRFAEITKGMTQEQIAAKLDCSVGQVNMMLSGKRKFHAEWISRIAKAWGIPEWQLFATADEIYPPNEKAIIAAYLKAADHKQQTVRDILGINEDHLLSNDKIHIDAKKNKPRSYKRTQ